ncbi:MAG TPA: DUF4145 domain-containing protein [Verrucomicrobiae bacterium]|jgi:hypothetical protein
MSKSELKFTNKRTCGHCGNRAPMVIVADYREVKHDYVEGVGGFNYGEWYEVLKCQSCEKVELRVHSYHQALTEEESPTVYKTIYPEAIAIPVGLPKKVKNEYEKALQARHGDSNGYGVLLGRVLEAVFHDKKAKGKMLGQQLQDLAKRNRLPQETLAFAAKLNSFRIVGAHFNKGKLTPKEIPIMEKLTKVILEYVYSAPYIMKQAEKTISKLDNKKLKKRKSKAVSASKIIIPIRRIVINSEPDGHFTLISIEMPDWNEKFIALIKKNALIAYEVYQMPTLNSEIRSLLFQHGYRMLVLKEDPDKRFLISKSYAKKLDVADN